MNAHYRLIHFTPDPFAGARFALGAVVSDERGQVRVARAEWLPSAACLGDRSLAVVVQQLHKRLDAVESSERLPSAFGPYATLAEPHQIPRGVDDAVAWVEATLSRAAPEGGRVRNPRGSNRYTLGYRFFETWKVARYVRKTFKPDHDWGGWLGRHGAGLPQVTHWVEGQVQALLLEPIIPTRHQFEQDLKDIATKFGAYQYALEQTENGRTGQLIAYVTGEGHPQRRAEAKEILDAFADVVVDTADTPARQGFLESIRQVGGESELLQEQVAES